MTTPAMMVTLTTGKEIDLAERSLKNVEQLYHGSYITAKQVAAYIEAWNNGPHFCCAVFDGKRVRLDIKNPESKYE